MEGEMNIKTDTTKTELISCDICMKEFPSEDAKISEIDDYVMHFCGLDCYDKWHNKVDQEKTIKS